MGDKMKNWICFIFYLFSIGLFAQDNPIDTVKYSLEFQFKEGIYSVFDQVKENNPIPKYKILTYADYHDPEFFDKVLKHEKIYYFNDQAVRKELKLSDIWGYSKKGVLYIRVGDKFNRITIVGGICHFVGTVTTTDVRFTDPYYNPYNYNHYYN